MTKIEDGRVRAGSFTWPERPSDEEASTILQSILFGIPMGALTLWSTSQNHEGQDEHDSLTNAARPDGLVMYVVTGGARAQVLARALLPKPRREFPEPAIQRAYIDPMTRTASVRRPDEAHDDLMPMDCVLDTGRYLDWATEANPGPAETANADRIATAFRDYQIMVAEVTNCDRAIIDMIRKETILRA